MKKKIHILVPGGGVKGCFQAGFLYRLFKEYKEEFILYKIDGTSSGALNSFGVVTNNLEVMKKNWLNASNMCDIFQNWSSLPLINIFLNKYYALLKMGLFNNSRIENSLAIEIDDNNQLDKFNCSVVNVTSGEIEYINGVNINIKKFVLASASPWILVPPVIINDQIYTDGGLIETYPFQNVNTSDSDLKILIGFDEDNNIPKYNKHNNVLSFILRLINVCRYNHNNIKYATKFISDNNIIKIDTCVNANFITVKRSDFINGFYEGEIEADKFVEKYLDIQPKGNIEKYNYTISNNSILKKSLNNISSVSDTIYNIIIRLDIAKLFSSDQSDNEFYNYDDYIYLF